VNDDITNVAEAYVEEQLRKTQEKMSALRKAKLSLQRGLPVVWHIHILSAWVNLGSHHEDEKPIQNRYQNVSLRSAIREAATDFCVRNSRSYPGRRYKVWAEEHVSTRWDVQGSWYVWLVLAPGVEMPIPKEMYQRHVDELKQDTDEIFGPEAAALKKRTLPTIP